MHNNDPKASVPGQTSNLPTNETVVSIIHHSKSQTKKDDELMAVVENDASLGDYEIKGSYETLDPPSKKQGLEQLLTPWGIGSLLIVLLANILLIWAQSTEKQLTNTSTNSQGRKQETSLLKSANLLPEKSQSLTLNNLSLISIPSPSKPSNSANNPIKAIPKPSAPSAVAPKPASNLTNALLPPSLQPQLLQTYPTANAPSPSLSQTLPVISVSQAQPVSPSVKPSPVQPSAVTDNAKKQAQLEQERILEQMYIREQKPQPLGFNHQTRAKLRAAGSQQAPGELIEQLQQLQQQKIDESNTATPIETNNPAQ